MKNTAQGRKLLTKKKKARNAKRRGSLIGKITKCFQYGYFSFIEDIRRIYFSIVDDFINLFKFCFPRLWRKIKNFEPIRDGSFEDYSESSRQAVLPKDVLGREGEQFVFNFIKENSNYELVACNAENYYCELDLIYLDKPERQIVFVEVKTRRHDYIKYPAFRAVDAKRRKKMALAAELFIKERGYFQYSIRFDVAVVVYPSDSEPTLKYYRNAFTYKYALIGYKKDDFGKTRNKKTSNKTSDKTSKISRF